MLSLKRFQGVAWTFLGFMLVAALVLDMRYKALDDGSGYLDTWTGAVRSTTTPARAHDHRLEVHVPSPVVIPERFEIVLPDPVVVREKIRIRVPQPTVAPEAGELMRRALEARALSELTERAAIARAQRLERSNVRFAFPAPQVYRFR